MAKKVVNDVEALSTSSDGDTTGNFVISIAKIIKIELALKLKKLINCLF